MQWRLFLLLFLLVLHGTHHSLDTKTDGWARAGLASLFRPPDDHFLRLAVAHASSLFPTLFMFLLVLADDAIAVTCDSFGLLLIRFGYPASKISVIEEKRLRKRKRGWAFWIFAPHDVRVRLLQSKEKNISKRR